MDLSRRQVMGAGAALAGVAAAGSVPALPAWAATAPAAPLRSMFTPLVGTTLRATRTGVTSKVVLAGVSDLDPAVAAAADYQFSLRFTTSATAMTDGIYRFSSSRLSAVDLFVQKVSATSQSATLTAIVYRLS